MGRRKSGVLSRIANLNRSQDERPQKRQKCNKSGYINRTSGDKENVPETSHIHIERVPEDNEQDLKPVNFTKTKFRVLIPKAHLNPACCNAGPSRHFHEFQINTAPDNEDIIPEDIPDCSDSDAEDSNDNHDDNHTPEDDICDIFQDGEDKDIPGSANPSIHRPGKYREAPTRECALEALSDITNILHPPRKKGHGYIDPGFDTFVRTRLEGIQSLLTFYTNISSVTCNAWAASSCQAAIAQGHGKYCVRQYRRLTRQFIADRTVLPLNPYGNWTESMLVDEDLVNDINLYLQEIGKEISAKKLQEYLSSTDVQEKHGITKPISERTARRYLNTLGYRFTSPKKGQYTDGHERDDVVHYRQHVFLPQWRHIQDRMESWITKDSLPEYGPKMPGRRIIAWFHDESIFYAHDRRKRSWYHKDAPATPYQKGEGASLMIADFVSADFGWLCSPDGLQSARRVMKPGKNKDGYFSNEDILEQATEAIKIIKEFYPQYEHVFIYDNATTHLKRPEDSLSARRMPKGIPKEGQNWGIEVTMRDPISGKIMYRPDGKPMKTKIPMGDARLADGTRQELYFPPGHEREGVFKGMAVILEERGFGDMSQVRAECKSFKCASVAPGQPQTCCCRRILYNQPDFFDVPSLLETRCKELGTSVLFLPKFHCELNFIEQCWGYAKRVYRLCPESSREDQLEKNALNSLASVPLDTMRKFANRARRFMDAYDRGLNGRQAAWAARKYRGHRVLPEGIMDELEKSNVA